MTKLDLSGLDSGVAEDVGPFLSEVVTALGEDLTSIAIVGAAVTPDFVRGRTDINSVAILKEIELRHLHAIAPLGRKHGRKGVAAPFLLTPAYIESSLDVFPVEFLDFRVAHQTVYGPDLLSDLEVKKDHLRLQCERELKAFLLRLRQGFIRAAGDARLLREVLSEAAAAIFPEIRAILHLLGKAPTLSGEKDLAAVCEALEIEGDRVKRILLPKETKEKPDLGTLESCFSDLYAFVQVLSEKVDAGLG